MGPASVWEGERVLARACDGCDSRTAARTCPAQRRCAARLKLVKMAAVAAYTSQRHNERILSERKARP